MNRQRKLRAIGILIAALALLVSLAMMCWPRPPSIDHTRNKRLMYAHVTIQPGMSRAEVEQALGEPDEREDDPKIERWNTTGHLGHTVTVQYEHDRVIWVEARTWRSRPDISPWERVLDRLGL